MKIEYLDAEHRGLLLEAKILKAVQSSKKFPIFMESGRSENFRFLVMELLGPSISLLRRSLHEEKLSKYCLLQLSGKMVGCIQKLHSLGYVHRDIKPGNFLIRPNRKSPVCLIDFGLSRCYINEETGLHKPARGDAGYTGTVRYSSLNAHDEKELSRRDDMMSWFYSVMELAVGELPWPGSEDTAETIRKKREMTPEQLCKNLPKEFLLIYNNIQNLAFEEAPDYDAIRELIDKAIIREKFKESDKKYDWEKMSEKDIKEISSIPLTMDEQNYLSEVKTIEVATAEEQFTECCSIC